MKLINKSGKTLRFKMWGAAGQPQKEYVVEPEGVCEVPDGYCKAAGVRKSAIEMKAPGLVPYTEPEEPKQEAPKEVVQPTTSRRKKTKSR